MDLQNIFQICNTIVLPGWIALIVFQRWKYLHYLIFSLCLLLALTYSFLLFSGPFNFDDFGSLEGVKSLFTSDGAVLAGWIHYLAFDMLVGYWMVKDAFKNKINRWIITPSLFLTFMAGPFGFLLYMVIRGVRLKALVA